MRLDVSIVVALIAGALVGGAGAQPASALFPITVNDRAAVKVGDKYGYIDKTGALVIPAMLDRAMKFSEGLAAAKLDKHYGYLDRAGTWVISPRFVWVRPFHGGWRSSGHRARAGCTSTRRAGSSGTASRLRSAPAGRSATNARRVLQGPQRGPT
jgi:hypothetical protein